MLMSNNRPVPTIASLKEALLIAEKIQRLQSDLVSVLQGTNLNTLGIGKKRGRPAKVDQPATVPAKKTVGKKRAMSEEGRQRIIEAQKKRWAAKRGAKS